MIWIGNQIHQAIGLYYQRSPGAIKRYPAKLEDLLEDRRYLSMQRYLRKIYVDPITGKTEWGLVPAPGGGIMGIYSTSMAKPIRNLPLSANNNSSASSTAYRDWRFAYEPPTQAPSPPATPVPATR